MMTETAAALCAVIVRMINTSLFLFIEYHIFTAFSSSTAAFFCKIKIYVSLQILASPFLSVD